MPSTDEWINARWYIHRMEYYSAIEMNQVLTHATAWMNLENSTQKREKPDPQGHTTFDSICRQIYDSICSDRK